MTEESLFSSINNGQKGSFVPLKMTAKISGSMSSKVAQNTLYLVSASVAQKAFSFIYFTLIARFIGVENVGLYVTALSYSSLFSILTDLGLTPVLIRETAKGGEHSSQEILGNVLTAKVLLSLAAYAILMVLGFLLGLPLPLRQLIFISGIIMVLDACSLTFYGVLRGHQNLRYEAMGVVGSQLTTILFGSIVLWFRGPVILLLLSLAAGSLFNIFWGFFVLSRRYKIIPKFIFNKKLLKTMIAFALPFALAGIFTKVYSYIDTVLLSSFLGSKAVGYYSIPSKITFAFQFIPMAFAAALFPAMSKFFVQDKIQLERLFEKGMIFLAMLALPLSFGIGALAELVIMKIYGPAYLPSVLPLKILLTSLVFAFLGFPIGALLNACHRQTVQTAAMGAVMTINIIMNIILIPKIGVVGAAIAALTGNFLLPFLGYLWVPKIIPAPGKLFWWKMLRIFVAAALMGLVVKVIQAPIQNIFGSVGFIKTAINFVLIIGSGMAIYAGLLFIFKVIDKTTIKDFIRLLKKEDPSAEESI